MATAEALMTAEEFGRRPDPGHPEELVQGRIASMPPPDRLHGYVRSKADRILGQFVEEHEIGRVRRNDSGIVTERDPDTVRGAVVAYYSYARLPRGPLPAAYGPEIPELVIEVRSANDRWREIHEKVAEYLGAGVLAIVVLDLPHRTAHVFNTDDPPRTIGPDGELVIPGILDGFRVLVARFFE